MGGNTTTSKQWYYKLEDGKHEFLRGPFTKQEILQKLEEGIINKNTLIRHGSGYWYPASQYLSNTPVYQKIEGSTVGDSKQWYYKLEDGKHEFLRGPFTKQEILQKLEEGIINKNTLIRHSSGYWHPASEHLSNTPIYQKIEGSTVGDSNKKKETKRDDQEWQAVKSNIQWDNLKTETKNTGVTDTEKEQKAGGSFTPPVEPTPSKDNEKLNDVLTYKKAIITVCILLLAILVFFTNKKDNIKSTNPLPNSIQTHNLAPARSGKLPPPAKSVSKPIPFVPLLKQPSESIPPVITSAENQKNQNIRIVMKIVDEYRKTHTYSEIDIFVCVDMAIDVWNMVKTKGINAIIMLGNVGKDVANIREANHAWVLAEVSPGEFIALETTGGFLVCPDSSVCSSSNPRYFQGWKFYNPRALKDVQEKSKNPCPAGYIPGADLQCHPVCGGNTYCADENSFCIDGQCRKCNPGYYFGTDSMCHKL